MRKTSTSVSNKLVDELPLVVGGAMRSAFDLAMIAPQANRPQGTPVSGNEADKAFAIGGGQAGGYRANLDGVTILTGRYSSVQWASVNTPSVDAITEFAVDTNGFKAEYGRAQGGVITFTSKSGTNEFHGTAYEFLRNDALDARRFFEARKGVYKQNDFGWSAGGPVYIPKLYDGRNKTFWFASMEWFRNRVGAASEQFSVPTPEMYRGDFRNWVDAQRPSSARSTIPRPRATRERRARSATPFPNNIIPAESNFTIRQSGAWRRSAHVALSEQWRGSGHQRLRSQQLHQRDRHQTRSVEQVEHQRRSEHRHQRQGDVPVQPRTARERFPVRMASRDCRSL